ncbi:DUF6221 family protein [Streptosporangium vulgare]|uniref:DUF6221 family protein n=1 Tax=Streptosporangium vulgare TaxID=46190 RepID=A0ABV5TQF9_9ACTN
MIVTLRSGTQISVQVDEYKIGRNSFGGLTALDWAGTVEADSRLRYLDLDEVAAVHTEWEPGDNDEEPAQAADPAEQEETGEKLSALLRARLDEDERKAKKAAQKFFDDAVDGAFVGGPSPEDVEHLVHHDPARVLREVEAKRRILDEHAPYWRNVEWPHDQNGKGQALCCRRCQNAAFTEWHPPTGQAGVLPEGFVAPYVLAPCTTLRLLAEGYGITEEET